MSHPAPTTPARRDQPLDMTGPARTFQHYEVLRRPDGSAWELGRGTMGITYKAFDVNLCCEVALKVVNAALLDHPNARERFVREARAAAALRHRNVASVYHLGNDGERFFYAMEFIDGETLDALVRRDGPLPVEDTLRLVEQTARALAAADRQQLVHRDIKPANLMVVHEDADDHRVVKVIDFGLARPVTGGGGSSGQLTVSGFVGTPQFASPEQLEERPLDTRADIYSLGVTAWFLLTGRAPFSGSLATICQQHLTQPPPLEQLPVWLPEPVRRLLLHMLEKDPARRPQNAVELRREIEVCLEAVRARPGAVAPPPPPAVRRPPAIDGGGGTLTGTILGGRYELVRWLGDGARGKIFEGRDTASDGEPVTVTLLPGERFADPAASDAIRNEVRLVQAAPHPHLTRVHVLERPTGGKPGFLVEERINGGTLVDLLAARSGVLPVAEALRLLGQAAAAADHAVGRRLENLGLSVHQVNLHFLPSRHGAGRTHEWRKQLSDAMGDWPAWTLKVDPLGRFGEQGETNTWAGEITLIPGHISSSDDDPERSSPGGLAAIYLRALAVLVYELLGGAPGGWGADPFARGRYISLPTLNEAANRALQEAFEVAAAGGTGRKFYDALARAAGFDPVNLQLAADQTPKKVSPTRASTARSTVTPAPAWPSPGSSVSGLGGEDFAATPFAGDETFGAGSISDRLTLVSGDSVPVGRWLFVLAALAGVFLLAVAGVWIALAQRLPRDGDPRPATDQVSPAPFAPPRESPRRPTRVPRPTIPPPLPVEASSTHSPAPEVAPPTVPRLAEISSATPAPPLDPPKAAKLVSVRIRSIPSGAEIISGGRTLGTTPLDTELSPGVHELIARYPGWPETRETMTLGSEQPSATAEIHLMPPGLVPAADTAPLAEAVRPRRVPPAAPHSPATRPLPSPARRPTASSGPLAEDAAPFASPTPAVSATPEVRRALPPLTPFDPDGPVPAHDAPASATPAVD